ncbi:MAG: efflux RND transporter periplasmic adaptor subunit, partial [Deltaproteobacteria bacterium]
MMNNFKKIKRLGGAVAAAIIALVLLGGCSEKIKPGTVEVKRKKVGPVGVVVAKAEKSPLYYVATGTVAARETATVSPQIMGRLLEVKVREGDAVKKGQILALVDDSEVQARVKAAEGMVSEAKSALQEVEAAVEQARSGKELAEKTFERFKKLYEEKIVSQQEFDEVKTRYEVAVKDYERALSKREQVRAKLVQAEAALERAKVYLEYTKVVAPFDGVVAKKFVDPGVLVSPAVPLFRIDRSGTYRLDVEVPETHYSQVKVGQVVSVEVPSAGFFGGRGKVVRVVPSLDPMSRSFTVKISLPPSAKVESGMFGRARIRVGTRESVFLPEKALLRVGGYEGVFVLNEENVARFVMVRTGERANGRVEILSGVVPGQRVVVDGTE